MHIETIEELVDVLHHSPLTRLEVEGEDWALALEKPPAPPKPAPASRPRPAAVPPTGETADFLQTRVESPIVGVFHEANVPIAVGHAVRAGDSLGSIEALALRNEVRSPDDGQVTEVHVEEGQPVEYGQTLFTLAPLERDE